MSLDPSSLLWHEPPQSQFDRDRHKLDRPVTVLEACPDGWHEQTQQQHKTNASTANTQTTFCILKIKNVWNQNNYAENVLIPQEKWLNLQQFSRQLESLLTEFTLHTHGGCSSLMHWPAKWQWTKCTYGILAQFACGALECVAHKMSEEEGDVARSKIKMKKIEK